MKSASADNEFLFVFPMKHTATLIFIYISIVPSESNELNMEEPQERPQIYSSSSLTSIEMSSSNTSSSVTYNQLLEENKKLKIELMFYKTNWMPK